MRTLILFLSILLFTLEGIAQQSAWLIVPGQRIGQIRLESPAQSLAVLGKPDGGDAAMMKAWRIWYSRKKDNSID